MGPVEIIALIRKSEQGARGFFQSLVRAERLVSAKSSVVNGDSYFSNQFPNVSGRRDANPGAADFALFGRDGRLGRIDPDSRMEKARSRALSPDTLGSPSLGG